MKTTIFGICILLLTSTASALIRKCDSLEITLRAKPGYTCTPANHLWLNKNLTLSPAWSPNTTEISDKKSQTYSVKDNHPTLGGFGRAHTKKVGMAFECKPSDDDNADKTITAITSTQENRDKVKPGLVSGKVSSGCYPVCEGDATISKITPGVCAGKHKHAGEISWVIG